MNLSNSPLGVKRILQITGMLQWNDVEKFIIFQYHIQSVDAQNILLTDKVINQNREVRYVLNNQNRVDAQFNPVQSGGTGEYDYFYNLLGSTSIISVANQLATKLNERGIFN